jgi:hypothetical protein
MKTNGLLYTMYAMDTSDEMDKIEELRDLIFWFGLHTEYIGITKLIGTLHDLQLEFNEDLEDDMQFDSVEEAETYFMQRVAKYAGIKVKQAREQYTFEDEWATWEWMKSDLDKWAELQVSKMMHLHEMFKRRKEKENAKCKTQAS